MTASLQVVFPGALASLQDLGRVGLRRAGVPRAGALVPDWLRIANVLAGNDAAGDNPVAIEFFGGGLQLAAEEAPLRLGLAGPFSAEVLAPDGTRRPVDSWRGVVLAPGEQLRCGMTVGARLGYVAVGGLAVPRLLGSASTYARAGFGRLLVAGDRLAAASDEGGAEQAVAPPAVDDGPIRVVPGPQADYFDAAAHAAFVGGDYRVTDESDRMGMRLAGPLLAHRPDKGADIASDATVPGSIQVPGNGQPIVLLNDGQTAGGYPKIATVISADLPRLAALPVGASLRFVAVSVEVAEAAARAAVAALSARCAALRPLANAGELDLDALYSANLLSGIVRAGTAD